MMVTLMLPGHITLVPRYILFNTFGWVGSYLPILVPKFLATDAFFVFLLVQFIRSLPKELEEAAIIDGCGKVGVFLRIIIPLASPALVTTALFTFLSDCPPRYRVVLGDARLSLAEAPDASFDLIVMDAFTSDAVPIHLITRDAIGLYVTKLRPAGVLVFNVSNRMLDVKEVLATIARDAGLTAITRYDGDRTEDGAKLTSEWVAMARSPEDLAVVRSADPGPSIPTTIIWRARKEGV